GGRRKVNGKDLGHDRRRSSGIPARPSARARRGRRSGCARRGERRPGGHATGQTARPNVMLLDINLPGMNGLQVARTLKDLLLDINIIMLTAYHDDEQVFHAIRAGASAYFPKAVSPRRLI